MTTATETASERRGGVRRIHSTPLRYPERRRGFDRRSSTRYGHALASLGENPRAIAGMLGLVLTLNAIDLVLTVQALGRGATEANPVMAWLFEQDLLLASAFKLGIGLFVALTIWRLRRYRRVLELGLVLTGVFVLVFGYHLVGRLFVTQ